jgi:hypothetical protein
LTLPSRSGAYRLVPAHSGLQVFDVVARINPNSELNFLLNIVKVFAQVKFNSAAVQLRVTQT